MCRGHSLDTKGSGSFQMSVSFAVWKAQERYSTMMAWDGEQEGCLEGLGSPHGLVAIQAKKVNARAPMCSWEPKGV